jgi:precorrin-8X/cobalt-precorrin-8 methylmutase
MNVMVHNYIREPKAIYAESFRRVRAATDLTALESELHGVALRLVHASGEPGIVAELSASPGAVARARATLHAGAPIFADCEMVAAGITRARLPAGNAVCCTLNDTRVTMLATHLQTTRSAAAVDLWQFANGIVAIGNAPTALFRLLERVEAGDTMPACVLGFCVGFVGATEAKVALAASGIPYIALLGRRGGSALASAAVNALASEAES